MRFRQEAWRAGGVSCKTVLCCCPLDLVSGVHADTWLSPDVTSDWVSLGVDLWVHAYTGSPGDLAQKPGYPKEPRKRSVAT